MVSFKSQIKEFYKLFGDSDYGLIENDPYIGVLHEFEFLSKSKDHLFLISICSDKSLRLDCFMYGGPLCDQIQWFNYFDFERNEFYKIKQVIYSILNYGRT